ncbi:enoyl-CoA hydratase-related protein [[Mycobacterium] crassicus]|uniref:Enoyl-CoA hydratase-related protein n=1 Tax=[Mycobacterium] crassicus TaxID=2872309 RepID=A0ABU5XMN6_9MYCO|nr:enoyl-CoA hydratase-related protein [Mycolicibacter sp. MYC098]MEB3023530.1 enoyl-CoA hydratase-related protein [Mycolicibacter sp. MYC098]
MTSDPAHGSELSMFTQIDYAVADAIATITLQRPDRLNAFTHTMADELVAACDLAENDDTVRAVVVTGSGRAFCAGADLDPQAAQFSQEPRPDQVFEDGVPRDIGGVVSLRFAAMLKPTIAAINGPAVGIGATMTLPMDIRIASDTARFGFVFVRRNLVPEAASSWFLPRVVGMSKAMEWVVTGRVFDAPEAHAAGLISEVIADGGVLDAAYVLAREITENASPVAVASAKQMLWAMSGAESPWAAHELDSRVLHELVASTDFAEGVAAFLERRKPQFGLRPRTDLPAAIARWPRGS